MRTVICHFYNEDYLLFPWLEHHFPLFDKAIMINYASTDCSVDIIEDYRDSTGWDINIIDSRNGDFGAMNVDLEVQEIENNIQGWKCCLNVTEHLYGDFSKCVDTEPVQYIIPSIMMVDTEWCDDASIANMLNWSNGIPYRKHDERAGRSFHNYNVDYPKPGRHFFIPKDEYTKDFLIFHYGWYPMGKKTIERKLQIQNRIPDTDRSNRLGWHHITTEEVLRTKWKDELIPLSEDCRDYLNFYRNRTEETSIR